MSDRFIYLLARFTLFILGVAACMTIIGLPIGIKILKDPVSQGASSAKPRRFLGSSERVLGDILGRLHDG